MNMQKNKIKKILLSGIFILSLFFIIPGIADAQSACADKLSGLNRYSSCQVLTGDTLVVNAEACTNACFKITNTTGKSVFIPTNTCAEWDAFLAHMPSGIATSSCITDPTISVSNTTKTYGDASFTITHSTNSAGAKTFSSSNTAVATITNAGVVTIVAGGTSTITFNTAATEDHYAGTATATLTVNGTTAVCSMSNATKTYGDASFTMSSSTNSNGTKTFSTSNSSVAGINGSTGLVNIAGAGSATITLNIAATANYQATSCTATVTVSKGTPTCTCSPTTKNYGDAAYTIGFTTNSTGTKSYSSGTTSVATINSSGLVTIAGAGTSTMTCNVAASTNHNAASCTGTQTVNKGNQATPAAPTLSSSTSSSIILNACSGGGCEYRRDGGSWQTSTTFSGLTTLTSYSFTQRKAATTNYNASDVSASANFSTICAGTYLDTRDGQDYPLIQIGNQCWMQKNLNYDTGSSWCYNNNSANCTTHGRLYNWSTATSACPSGWHPPSDAEWKTLEMHLGMTQAQADATGWRGTNQGSQLSTLTLNGTNSSGFTALMSGYRTTSGSFRNLDSYTYFWSSTESGSYAWHSALGTSYSTVDRGTYSKDFGFSVRCLRN
jgi:uncharacterized protein (TIGR02145 family)